MGMSGNGKHDDESLVYHGIPVYHTVSFCIIPYAFSDKRMRKNLSLRAYPKMWDPQRPWIWMAGHWRRPSCSWWKRRRKTSKKLGLSGCEQLSMFVFYKKQTWDWFNQQEWDRMGVSHGFTVHNLTSMFCLILFNQQNLRVRFYQHGGGWPPELGLSTQEKMDHITSQRDTKGKNGQRGCGRVYVYVHCSVVMFLIVLVFINCSFALMFLVWGFLEKI